MKKKIINKLAGKIAKRCNDEYPNKIQIHLCPDVPVSLRNGNCHHNSVHMVKVGKAACVVECVMIGADKDWITAHYIVLKNDGKFYDPTLGYQWIGSDYRIIRIVPESEYGKISDSLDALKRKICGKIPAYARALDITPNDLC